ncbi:MAG: Gx transporter family protein [Eubacteriales bacterium]
MKNKGKSQVAIGGVLLSLAILVSYVELIIPIPVPIVGMKLGLVNVVILVVLYLLGTKEAYVITITRVFLVSLLFGNAFSMVYSLSGAICSIAVMSLLKSKTKTSLIAISIAGALFHSIGQVAVAVVILHSLAILVYLPSLLLVGMITGALIGMIAQQVLRRVTQV